MMLKGAGIKRRWRERSVKRVSVSFVDYEKGKTFGKTFAFAREISGFRAAWASCALV